MMNQNQHRHGQAEEIGTVSGQYGISSSKILERELGKRMKANAYLKELVGDPVPIFTAVAETTPLPYILYNESRFDNWDTDTSLGGEHTISIQFWTERESEAYVKEICHIIRDSLNRCEKFISISPYKLVLVDYQFQDVVREVDGQAFVGTVQFRALTGGGH